MADTPNGLCLASGHIVDMAEGGCALHLKTYIAASVAARVRVEVGRTELWLPVVTRWVVADGRGWKVGCSFDRPTPEKQRAIRALVWERRNLVKS
jgi:hypothetical protein